MNYPRILIESTYKTNGYMRIIQTARDQVQIEWRGVDSAMCATDGAMALDEAFLCGIRALIEQADEQQARVTP